MSEETAEQQGKRKTVKELESELLELQQQYDTLRENFDANLRNIQEDVNQRVNILEARIEAASYDRDIRELAQDIKEVSGKVTYMETSSETAKLRAELIELEKELDMYAEALVCVLLTQCRGITEMGWEKVLKRYWKTTGGVVFPEDKVGLRDVLDNNRKINVIKTFLDFSFGENG